MVGCVGLGENGAVVISRSVLHLRRRRHGRRPIRRSRGAAPTTTASPTGSATTARTSAPPGGDRLPRPECAAPVRVSGTCSDPSPASPGGTRRQPAVVDGCCVECSECPVHLGIGWVRGGRCDGGSAPPWSALWAGVQTQLYFAGAVLASPPPAPGRFFSHAAGATADAQPTAAEGSSDNNCQPNDECDDGKGKCLAGGPSTAPS